MVHAVVGKFKALKMGKVFFCVATGCVGRDVDFEVSKLLHLSSYHMENTPLEKTFYCFTDFHDF